MEQLSIALYIKKRYHFSSIMMKIKMFNDYCSCLVLWICFLNTTYYFHKYLCLVNIFLNENHNIFKEKLFNKEHLLKMILSVFLLPCYCFKKSIHFPNRLTITYAQSLDCRDTYKKGVCPSYKHTQLFALALAQVVSGPAHMLYATIKELILYPKRKRKHRCIIK